MMQIRFVKEAGDDLSRPAALNVVTRWLAARLTSGKGLPAAG
jgi:hypothetical protein